MYQDEYYILKESGTYSNILEAFGLAVIFNYIFKEQHNSVKIIDTKTHYVIKLSNAVSKDLIENIKYSEFIPYIKYKDSPPADSAFVDYEKLKSNKDIFQKFVSKEPKPTKAEIENFETKPDPYWDLYSNFNKLKALSAYKKIFFNIKSNQDEFVEIIKTILLLYSKLEDCSTDAEKYLKKLEKGKRLQKLDKVNALQIFNPHQGKGVNAPKANSISLGGESAFWLQEYLKIIGSYKSMLIRVVKVSNKTWDTKIYVIEPNEINYEFISKVFTEFRPTLKGSSSFKLDISSILRFCQAFIKNIDEYKRQKPFLTFYNPQHSVNGFYTVYLKKLGTSESVSNLSFLQLPSFINIESAEDCLIWEQIISEHLYIITHSELKENGLGLEVLSLYRLFLTTSINEYLYLLLPKYNILLMQSLVSKSKYRLKPFSQNLLKELLILILIGLLKFLR